MTQPSPGQVYKHNNYILYFSFTDFCSYLLPDEKNIKSCKTKRVQKSSSPVWDEYFVIDGVAQSQLRKQQLGIRVINWHLGINKKNSLLGELRIACRSVFDFHSLASPIITSPSDRLLNERVVYSPLVRGNLMRERNGRPVSEIRASTGGLESFNDHNEDNQSSTGRSVIRQNSEDNVWSDSETVDPLVQNLKRINATSSCNDEQESSNNISIHVSKCNQDTDVMVSEANSKIKNNGDNNNKDNKNKQNSPKETKVKPPRPPPPNRLSLTDGQLSPDVRLSPRSYNSNPHIPDSNPKVFTPTFSRLLSNLPKTPKRGRRISWGGESDLSLGSPRSLKSPTDQQSMESGQWDIMISRPKQWIYCWQALVVSVSE